ncbi:MAG: CvpA family protein [Methylococcales symbiont of Hymedesmia sp. n. MRB-2018]|nr:MAG: CvpA family protein [Methylococcales symbiont of Hymedesmia sp. n. MRB-2018]KAF3983072.1 MAG: CvpA family protein [Methylococcales symbiont of Hymedesmia sp. n. MRB-2018]
MIWIDYTIIGLVLISSIIGLLRGFIKEAFSLIIWMIAIWVGLTFSREFSVFLEQFITYPSARIAAAFAILFILTLIIGAMISYLLGELVKKTGLTGSDRFAGMIFGIARGLVVVSVVVMLAGLTPLPEDSWWKESDLIPPFQSLAVWLREHIPSGLARYIKY